MTGLRIELIYFDGCPHADRAREHLRRALGAELPGTAWREWNRDDPAAPAWVKRYGSPTVLVNGVDVAGSEQDVAAAACRMNGAPSVDAIRAALAR